MGYTVTTAADGPAALERHRHDPPALVLTDLKMSGMELLEQIHRDYPEVPVLMITAFGTNPERRGAGNEIGSLRLPDQIDRLRRAWALRQPRAGAFSACRGGSGSTRQPRSQVRLRKHNRPLRGASLCSRHGGAGSARQFDHPDPREGHRQRTAREGRSTAAASRASRWNRSSSAT
jgi:CheY-like chemotaxis protein